MTGPAGPERYEIRLEGVLEERWAAWFGGLQVSSDGTQTVIAGPLADQAALHGVLAKIRDLGVRLISVRRADPRAPAHDRTGAAADERTAPP